MYDRPFRWWVQSVMPLVFDDSLSYYEVLAKLTKYIEGLTGDVEQIEKILGTIEGIEDITQFTEMLESIKAEIGNLSNLSTQSKTDLVSAINEVALKADIAYWKPPTGIPENDLSQSVQDKLNRTGEVTKYIINNKELKAAPSNNSPADLGLGTYTVPTGGIPWDTLSQDVQDRINAGGSGTGGTTDYTDLNNKPQINGHTLNAGNNTSDSLGLGTYSKPSTGIPESDLSAEVQEKLNTSGGIADNQESFVASRDYEAGELVYINGTLYKTIYKILVGTTMIPGNNIEVTDISSELEKINSDIDALQSGAGPDSWNLTTNVQSFSYLEKVDFFEYFNCIGGESYSFIVEPVNPSTAMGYILEIRKRDGTVVLTQTVTDATEYLNRKRFTFIPNDSGEYYCTFYRNASGYTSDLSAVKVTIEYTQSQGISELWTQVNAATQLEPRVSAVETLVNQHTTQLQDLGPRVSSLETLTNNHTTELQEIDNEIDNINSALYDGYEVLEPVWSVVSSKEISGQLDDVSSDYGILTLKVAVADTYRLAWSAYDINDTVVASSYGWKTEDTIQMDISNSPTVSYIVVRMQNKTGNGSVPLSASSNVTITKKSTLESMKESIESIEEDVNTLKSPYFVYVDGTNGNDNNTGSSWSSSFKTISKAIDSGAHNILIRPGTYGPINLQNKHGISLMLDRHYDTFTTGSDEDYKPVVIDGDFGSTNTGIIMVGCENITLDGFEIRNFTALGILARKSTEITIKNTTVHDIRRNDSSGTQHGYSFEYADVDCIDCTAYNIGTNTVGAGVRHCDGFNIHYTGVVNLYNCIAYNCEDDGASHHDATRGVVDGGEWHHNGKGGIASPTYGAKVDIRNVYCHDNKYGLQMNSSAVEDRGNIIVNSCVCKNNSTKDIAVLDNLSVILINCVYDTLQGENVTVYNTNAH